MTKSQLMERICERFPSLSKKDARVIINAIFDTMVEALRAGDRIELRGFGSFRTKARGGRQGRNPRTGAEVMIPGKRVPAFKVGKELREKLNVL
ncbi:MAG: integration host factor subunit beta [Deltaproteobacteria bacterium]|nr:integration host factor subunit beta [Deltaproteobacteria bacterium]MBI3075860.1 integration host factor subunit beta [Deltaproteobacteria bacterium]